MEHFKGLNKIMSDWKHIKGVHKPAGGKEDQGISETGEKVRTAHSLRTQGLPEKAEHQEQKARIRHDDVLAQIKQMGDKVADVKSKWARHSLESKPLKPQKASAADYGVQSEHPKAKVAQIQHKWSKLKGKLAA